MPVSELERYLSTPTNSAEIQSLQPLQEIKLAPNVGRNSQLEGTGFNLPLELTRFFKNYNQNLRAGKEQSEALMLSVSELEVNIRTFIVEYIQTKTVLPHVNRLEEIDGVVRMVGQNGVPIVSGITSAERYGSTLKASRKVEDFLTTGGLQKAPSRLAVINSPLGHSGLVSEKGEVINYKNNQTLVFWTDKNVNMHGLTLVTDLDKDQSKKLSISLGITEDLLKGETETEEVANIVANPALFSYGRSIGNPAKYVFEKILAIRGNSDIRLEQEDGTVEYRSVAQTWQDIENFEFLLEFSTVWENCLKKLRGTIIYKENNLNDPFVQAQITRMIEETILEITVDYLQQTKPEQFHATSFSSNARYSDSGIRGIFVDQDPNMDKFAVAASFLRTRSGCNSGGRARTALRGTSFGSSSLSGTSRLERRDGACEACGRDGSDGHYHCPDCNLTYTDETDVAPENRTKNCSCGFVFECGV